MKKLLFIFILFLFPNLAFGFSESIQYDIRAIGGTCTYVVDLSERGYKGGPIGIEIASVNPGWDAATRVSGFQTSGTSLTLEWAASNLKSSVAQALAEFTPVFAGVSIDPISGNSNGRIWTFTPPPADNLFLQAVGGITTMRVGINVASFERSTYVPHGVPISTEYISMNENSGISILTVPDGTWFAEVSVVSGGSIFYTRNGTDPCPTGTTSFTLEKDDYRDLNRYEADQFRVGVITTTVLRASYFTDKP